MMLVFYPSATRGVLYWSEKLGKFQKKESPLIAVYVYIDNQCS